MSQKKFDPAKPYTSYFYITAEAQASGTTSTIQSTLIEQVNKVIPKKYRRQVQIKVQLDDLSGRTVVIWAYYPSAKMMRGVE